MPSINNYVLVLPSEEDLPFMHRQNASTTGCLIMSERTRGPFETYFVHRSNDSRSCGLASMKSDPISKSISDVGRGTVYFSQPRQSHQVDRRTNSSTDMEEPQPEAALPI